MNCFRRYLWTDFDRWIDEEPSERRVQFEVIRSALLAHCEHASIVVNKTGEEKEPPMQKFTNFMNVANQTEFLQAPSWRVPSKTIFDILEDIFTTIPEFQSENGINHDILNKYSSEMLDPDLDWDSMYCYTKIFRSVYWQLLFTLQLAPVQSENQTEETMVYDANRPKLMFGCFISAVLVGIAYENEDEVASKITDYYEKDDLHTYLLMLISSTHFRVLSEFFIVGLWLLKRDKMDGGSVTSDQQLTQGHMEEQFRNILQTIEEQRNAVDQKKETGEARREQRYLWTDFDRWIDEKPSERRVQFEVIRSALLAHYEYASLVINKTGEEKEPPIQKFTSFMNAANQTKFLQAPSWTVPSKTIVDILEDIFTTIPEFQSENGINHDILKKYSSEMLDPDLDWDSMYCYTKIFRSVYWQLLFTLQLAPVQSENQTEETMVYDANRPKLMFGCFILAILVGIANENEDEVASKITDYDEKDDLHTYLFMLISSTHFRVISQFFIVGLWLLKRDKMDGGSVTSDQQLTQEQIEEEIRNILRTIEKQRNALEQK